MLKYYFVAFLFFFLFTNSAFAYTGYHRERAYSFFCDASGTVGTMQMSFTASTTAQTIDWLSSMSGSRTGLDNCRLLDTIYYKTFDFTTLDYLYIDYKINVLSGTCYFGYDVTGEWGSGTFTTHTTSTTTTMVIDNSGNGFNSITSFGLALRVANSGASSCTGYVTRIYDNLGNDYIHWYDTDLTGGGSGSTIFIGDILGNMTTEWECTTSGDTTNCIAIATTSIDLYDGANLQEWLFVSGVVIFFLSFLVWPRISFKREDNTKT